MKNITELEYRLRKYTSDKTRLEKEHEQYANARAMTPERYLQEIAYRRPGEHDPTGMLAVTYQQRFKFYRKMFSGPSSGTTRDTSSQSIQCCNAWRPRSFFWMLRIGCCLRSITSITARRRSWLRKWGFPEVPFGEDARAHYCPFSAPKVSQKISINRSSAPLLPAFFLITAILLILL